MNKFLLITQLINGLVLIRFSISKLLSWPISVKAFVEMARPLGIDPTFFRFSTGVLISTVCLSFLMSFFLTISNKLYKNSKLLSFAVFSNLIGVGSMTGALIAEFFLRVEPKWPLVFIAIFIIVTSIVNLRHLIRMKQRLF